MFNYWLAQHAYLCSTEDQVVILDLRADRYLALPHSQSDAVGRMVEGWPLRCDSEDPVCDSNAIAMRLFRAGLLTTERALGKEATPNRYMEPATPLVETALLHTLLDNAPRPPKITFLDLLRLASAYLRARTRTRRHGLEQIINDVKARRVARSPCNELDTDTARQLVTKFRLLRAFFYSAREQCLLDSYVLVEFLAKYHLYPAWIFAVQTRPFKAHCWLQQNGLVFNDSVEHVSSYVPIMVV